MLVLQELVEQIAIGAMNFDAVEAGGLGILSALLIGGDDAGNFLRLQRPRGDIFLFRPHQRDMPFGPDGAGRHRRRAVQENGIGNASDMPKLQQHAPACAMHRLGDFFQPSVCSSDQMPGVAA